MASIWFARPGSKYGPCVGGCKHRDCSDARRIVNSKCAGCGKVLGYDPRVFPDIDGQPWHEACYIDYLDKQRVKGGVGRGS